MHIATKKRNLTKYQNLSLDIFGLLLIVDIVYTSIGVLSGRFVELNPYLNPFISFPIFFISILVTTHIVYFFTVIFFVLVLIAKRNKEGGTNKYTNFLISMVCYIPCCIMVCAMIWIATLNLVSLGVL